MSSMERILRKKWAAKFCPICVSELLKYHLLERNHFLGWRMSIGSCLPITSSWVQTRQYMVNTNFGITALATPGFWPPCDRPFITDPQSAENILKTYPSQPISLTRLNSSLHLTVFSANQHRWCSANTLFLYSIFKQIYGLGFKPKWLVIDLWDMEGKYSYTRTLQASIHLKKMKMA